MQTDDSIIVWGLTGLTVFVVALFLGTTLYQPPPVNGEGIPDGDTKDDTGGDDQPSDGQDTPVVPQELSQSAQDSVSISDNIDFTVSPPPVSPGGFRPGIPIERGNGNGDNDGDDVNGEEPPQILDAIVHVVPEPVPSPGINVQAFGITNASSATHAIFELFGPECPLEGGIPCAVESDSTELSPPSTTSETGTLCISNLCEEYSVVFLGEHLDVKGEYHIKVTFFDANDNAVVIKGMNFRVHSFFVVPESQIGAIALILSSLGTLVFIYYVRVRKK